MHVVFDARGIQDRSDGMSNYLRAMLRGLARQRTSDRYTVLLQAAARQQPIWAELAGSPHMTLVSTTVPFMGLAQQAAIPRLLRRLPAVDLYHYPHFDLPVGAHRRSVVTIYDLNHVTLPGYFDSSRWLKRWYSRSTTAMTVRVAQQIITISEWSRQRLLERFSRLDPSRVTAIHFGVDAHFQRQLDDATVRAFRRRHGLGEDRFILYVGTHRPHKNVARLVQAYGRLRAGIPHKLLLIGSSKGRSALAVLIQSLHLDDAVRLIPYLADEDLPLAYRVADVFAFCSLSEGFGLPLLEAMASGVPVVTSDRGAMMEVTDGSAVYVDPTSVDAIAEGLHRVLGSPMLAEQLSARGRARAQQFRWEQTVHRTLAVYRHALEDAVREPAEATKERQARLRPVEERLRHVVQDS